MGAKKILLAADNLFDNSNNIFHTNSNSATEFENFL
jgi:hypothetical protein